MRLIDEEYTRHLFYGSRRFRVFLESLEHHVCQDKVRNLMQVMGIEALYAKPRLSVSNLDHIVYPYLLRGFAVERCNLVWSTDITYIRMRNGFLYLTAVIDWYSRYVLSWRLSNSLEGEFCREVVKDALEKGKPDVFNVDQGSQYTCREFVDLIISQGIKLSMDGKGRCIDNVFVERLWRTVKYEEVYLKDYEEGFEAYKSLSSFFNFYDDERLHQSLGYVTQAIMYMKGSDNKLGAMPPDTLEKRSAADSVVKGASAGLRNR